MFQKTVSMTFFTVGVSLLGLKSKSLIQLSLSPNTTQIYKRTMQKKEENQIESVKHL